MNVKFGDLVRNRDHQGLWKVIELFADDEWFNVRCELVFDKNFVEPKKVARTMRTSDDQCVVIDLDDELKELDRKISLVKRLQSIYQ